MFYGEYRHALDEKNRLFIPAKLRQPPGEERPINGFFVTMGMEQTLFLFTAKGFEELRQSFSKLSFTRLRQREFQRTFYANTTFAELDPQGRVLIPDTLKGWAVLKRDVAILGVENRIELWDSGRWERYRKQSSGRFEKTADELFKPF